MRRYLPVIFFLLLGYTVSHAQRINVFPTTVSYNVSQGSIQNQTVYITNPTTTKQVFQVSVADWVRNDDGSHTYFEANSQNFSCANWVTVSSNLVDVEPGQTAELSVTMQGSDKPEDFEKMKWAMLFLQNVVERQGEEMNNKKVNTQIREVIRVGIHLYQTPASLTSDEARAMALESDSTDLNAYWFKVQNTGKTMISCKAYLDLTETSTGQQYRSEITEFPMFPEGNRKVKLVVPPTVPKGKYSMLAILDYSESASLEAVEKNIEIVR
jgi:P pilus assembly chaperone PapD